MEIPSGYFKPFPEVSREELPFINDRSLIRKAIFSTIAVTLKQIKNKTRIVPEQAYHQLLEINGEGNLRPPVMRAGRAIGWTNPDILQEEVIKIMKKLGLDLNHCEVETNNFSNGTTLETREYPSAKIPGLAFGYSCSRATNGNDVYSVFWSVYKK